MVPSLLHEIQVYAHILLHAFKPGLPKSTHVTEGTMPLFLMPDAFVADLAIDFIALAMQCISLGDAKMTSEDKITQRYFSELKLAREIRTRAREERSCKNFMGIARSGRDRREFRRIRF